MFPVPEWRGDQNHRGRQQGRLQGSELRQSRPVRERRRVCSHTAQGQVLLPSWLHRPVLRGEDQIYVHTENFNRNCRKPIRKPPFLPSR